MLQLLEIVVLCDLCSAASPPLWVPEDFSPLLPRFRMPILGLGTAAHGDGNSDGTVEMVVAGAVQCGIRLFDTAQVSSSSERKRFFL